MGGEIDKRLVRRTGRSGLEKDEDGKTTGDPQEQEDRLQNRMNENKRLVAVYAAREQRTRAVEGRWMGWRDGRADSWEEWKFPRGDRWNIVAPTRRVAGSDRRGMQVGANVVIKRGGVWMQGTVEQITADGSGRFWHELRIEDAELETCDLQKEEWMTESGVAEGKVQPARLRGAGREKTPAGSGSMTGVAPRKMRDILMGRQAVMKDDGIARARQEIRGAIREAERLVKKKEGVAGRAGKTLRRALIAMMEGRDSGTQVYYDALMAVIGGVMPGVDWRGEKELRDAYELHIRMAQAGAANAIERWMQMGRQPRKWTARRERARERMKVIMWAWREAVRRSKGEWGVDTVSDAGCDASPVWLPAGMIEEWSARPGISAVAPGSRGAWLMAYVKRQGDERRRKRRQHAAWRTRMEGPADWRARYITWVKRGLRPVGTMGNDNWKRWCQGMEAGEREGDGDDVKSNTIRFKRTREGYEVDGTDAMAMRRVVRALRLEGEVVTVAVARAGSGHGQLGTRKDAVAKPAGRRAMGLRWKRSRVGAAVLELMRAEMRQAKAWVAGQEASGEDDAAWDGANATDDVDGEWEEAQWEGDGVEMTEGDGEEKANDQEWHEPEEWELEMAREADTDQEWHEPAEWELEMAREADAFGDG